MTPVEFDNQFDVLYNNITSNQAPGLNTYEKSLFLTKAQDEVLKNHFLPQSNPKQAGYDDNQKRQADFSGLMETSSKAVLADTTGITKFDDRGILFQYPTDVFLVINETYKKGTKTLQIVPLPYNEYTVLMSKPYKRPLKNQAWRLITQGNRDTKTIEVIVGADDDTDGTYTIRYIRKPKPIILGNLDGLTIGGYKYAALNSPDAHAEEDYPSTSTPYWSSGCELDPILHEEILQRAVELAKVAWQGDVNTAVTAGQRSE